MHLLATSDLESVIMHMLCMQVIILNALYLSFAMQVHALSQPAYDRFRTIYAGHATILVALNSIYALWTFLNLSMVLRESHNEDIAALQLHRCVTHVSSVASMQLVLLCEFVPLSQFCAYASMFCSAS